MPDAASQLAVLASSDVSIIPWLACLLACLPPCLLACLLAQSAAVSLQIDCTRPVQRFAEVLAQGLASTSRHHVVTSLALLQQGFLDSQQQRQRYVCCALVDSTHCDNGGWVVQASDVSAGDERPSSGPIVSAAIVAGVQYVWMLVELPVSLDWRLTLTP